MPPVFALQPIDATRWCWQAGAGELEFGSLAEAAASLRRNESATCVLLLPAEAFVLTEVPLPHSAPARLRQAAPFALEEHLLSDSEDMVVAIGDRTPADTVVVASTDRSAWQNWMDALHQAGIACDHAAPDALCLPWEPGQVTRLEQPSRVLLRWGYGSAAAVGSASEAAVRATLDGAANIRDMPGSDLQQLAENALHGPVNLLQGDYAPAGQQTGWRLFRRAAGLAGVALILATALQWLQAHQWEQHSDALAAQIRTEFQQVFPEVQRVQADPAPQIQLALRQMDRGGNDRSMLTLIRQAAPLLASAPGVQLRRLNYDDGALLLELNAGQLDQLDGLRLRLQSAGLSASLGGTRVDNDRVTGSITVRNDA